MFAMPATAPDRLPPTYLSSFLSGSDGESTKAAEERPTISPYLRRPLRRLEEVQKKREKMAKPRDKNGDVNEQR
ncbi:MAG: hypothetical protein IT563_15675 [Alphaproteobacteria bacterium]|nr:hypothetical protein [Alphaproteobacteria bacterium]